MPRAVLAALLLAIATALAWAGEPPLRTLARGELSIDVALPDREHGHYRGTRFDHGGIVTQARFRGRTFLGLLKPPHRPESHDGAAGTPEEFHIENPPGFAEAADGGAFLKIGVGALVRPDRTSYRFFAPYRVAQPAAWTVREEPDAITCTHEASAGAYAVRGTRTIALLPEGDGFVIARELTNTGTAELPVEHYNHTMVVIDGAPIGEGYTLTYPAPVTVTHKKLAADGAVVRFAGEMSGAAWTEVKGLPHGPEAATVRIAHGDAAVELSGDTAPTKVVIYAERTAICPEVFVSFVLKPGESRHWSQTYRFSTATPRP